MEELHQALEQFKQEGAGASTARSTRTDPGRAVPPPIVYSKTKVVECDEEILHRHHLLAGHERGAFMEGHKLLRTQICHRLKENQWNVLGVTSARDGEGKSVTATNLAISLALEATQTVLLIDATLRAPSLHRLFGLGKCRGLTEYLIDEVPLEELLIHPGIGRFVLLPGGRPLARSTEALTSPRMRALIEEVKHRYPARVVVIDLPSLLPKADVLAFAPLMDAILLVACEGKTRRWEVEESINLIGGAVPIIGTVLTQAGRDDLSLGAMMELVSRR
jgi:Mrp family chromosome partitioning ATPase